MAITASLPSTFVLPLPLLLPHCRFLPLASPDYHCLFHCQNIATAIAINTLMSLPIPLLHCDSQYHIVIALVLQMASMSRHCHSCCFCHFHQQSKHCRSNCNYHIAVPHYHCYCIYQIAIVFIFAIAVTTLPLQLQLSHCHSHCHYNIPIDIRIPITTLFFTVAFTSLLFPLSL